MKVTGYIYDPTLGKDVPIDEASEETKEIHYEHMAKVGKVVGMSELWRITGHKFRFVDANEEIEQIHRRVVAFEIFPISMVSVKPMSKPDSSRIQIDYDEDGQWYYMVTPYRKMPFDDHEMKTELERLKREAEKRRTVSNKK